MGPDCLVEIVSVAYLVTGFSTNLAAYRFVNISDSLLRLDRMKSYPLFIPYPLDDGTLSVLYTVQMWPA